MERITRSLALRLDVRGLINLQLASKDERIWVLEANPRASRTVPFVSKVTGVPLAVATSVMLGRTLAELRDEGLVPAEPPHYLRLPHTAVKAAVLPFGRFPGVDTLLGPEMRSTGEVMGIDADPDARWPRPWSRAAPRCPARGRSSSRSRTGTSGRSCMPAKRLADLGFRLLATQGTAACSNVRHRRLEGLQGLEGGRSVVELIRDAEVDLVVNTPFGRGPRTDGSLIRAAAAQAGIPCITTLPAVSRPSRDRVGAGRGREPRSLQEYHAAAEAAAPSRRRLCFGHDPPGWRPDARASRGRTVRRVRAEVLNAKRVGAYHSITIVAPRWPNGSVPGSSSRSRCPRGRTFLLRRHFSIHQASGAGDGPAPSSSCSIRAVVAGPAGSPRSRRISSST